MVIRAMILSFFVLVLATPAVAVTTDPSPPTYTSPSETIDFEVVKGDWFGTLDTVYTAKAVILLANASTTPGRAPTAEAILADGNLATFVDGTTVAMLPAPPANQVVEITLEVLWSEQQPNSGWLVVSDVDSEANPLVLPFQVKIIIPPWLLALKTLISASVVALVVLWWTNNSLKRRARKASKALSGSTVIEAPNDKWSFKDSFATNVTTVGAVITTVLAASGFITEVLPGLQIGFFVALSLLFGFLVLLGPAAYGSLSNEAGKGTYLGLMVSMGITTGAVVGQLSTLTIMLHRGGIQQAWGTVGFFIGVLIIAGYMHRSAIALVLPSLKPGEKASRSPTL